MIGEGRWRSDCSRHFQPKLLGICASSYALDSPIISAIANQAIDEDTQTEAIAFTIWDDNTPLDLLTVATRSSNTNLVPDGNIRVAGAGRWRTVTVIPALNQSGTSKITIECDGQEFRLLC